MRQISILSPDIFTEDTRCVSIGQLSAELTSFILEKKTELSKILNANENILFWADRVKHTEAHRNDFLSDLEYEKCFSDIPQIIANPDFVSVRPKGDSISFIKHYSSHVLVAVRISPKGKLSYRTMYTITSAQLHHYIERGFAWKYNDTR